MPYIDLKKILYSLKLHNLLEDILIRKRKCTQFTGTKICTQLGHRARVKEVLPLRCVLCVRGLWFVGLWLRAAVCGVTVWVVQ